MKAISKYLPGVLIFFLCVILALFIYKDYGVAWDEFVQREMGIVSYEHITKGDPKLETYLEKDHGTGFEIPLIFIEQALELTDSRDIFLMRHFATHLFFLTGCFFGYILCYRLFRNNVIACIGFLMLLFHPRLYAHSFFNTKDLPFVSAFIIAMCFLQIAFDKDRWYWYAIAGTACGYATSIRILGLILPGIIAVCFLADIVSAFYKKEKAGRVAGNSIVFLTTFCLVLYICFPTLWHTPFKSLAEVFESMSRFRWVGGVLFRSEVIMADQLPWSYIPVWFGITTPIVWLVLGVWGIAWVMADFIRKPRMFLLNNKERNFGVYAVCCLVPVLAIVMLKSVVYDDWRHVYFIYPAFVLLCLYAVNKLYKSKVKVVLVVALSVQYVTLAYFMIESHPHQQVYFNALVSKKPDAVRYNYDQDYWFCSMKQGLEYILRNDANDDIKIHCPLHDPMLVAYNMAILPYEDRKRLKSTNAEEADYIVVNFRDHKEDYPYGKVLYEVRVNNSAILRVYEGAK